MLFNLPSQLVRKLMQVLLVDNMLELEELLEVFLMEELSSI